MNGNDGNTVGVQVDGFDLVVVGVADVQRRSGRTPSLEGKKKAQILTKLRPVANVIKLFLKEFPTVQNSDKFKKAPKSFTVALVSHFFA